MLGLVPLQLYGPSDRSYRHAPLLASATRGPVAFSLVGDTTGMLFHLVPLADWAADPASPYRPPSLAAEGFVHCSADEASALAVADARYRHVPGELLVLSVDEARLSAPVRWAGPYPHVHGPVERSAVTGVRRVRRGPAGEVLGLDP